MNLAKVLRAVGATLRRFAGHLIARYKDDGCSESAAALTYMSLFAVVPLMTLMYAMFSIIPSFQGLGEEVERLLFENLVPQSGREVQQYLRDFSGQARKLSSVGAFILVITSYLMLANIEKTFNHIWGTVGGRRGLASFLLYWGVLSFGPLLVGAGLMMHTYLLSFQLIVDEVDTLGITALALQYLPWFMTWAGFTLLFVAMPNCRVVLRYAVAGGLVTTVLFELAKSLFGLLVINSSYQTVYGAFAIVPLFLLWIYLCWMIVLGGAELVRSMETFNVAVYRRRLPDLLAVLMVCCECLRFQARGASLGDRDVIKLGIHEEQWRKLRNLLLDNNLIVTTAANTFVLARDPSTLTVWELSGLLGYPFTASGSAGDKELRTRYPWSARIEKIFIDAGNHNRALLGVTLHDLYTEKVGAENAA